jgi:steroid delta-isomerase-like uncharacterized protein
LGVAALENNKALVRRWLDEVFTRGDLGRANDLFAPNYTLHDPSFPGAVYGPEGVKRYVRTYREAFPDARFTVEDQVAEEETVATRWTARGTHRGAFLGISPTGDRVTVSGIEFSRVVGDRIDEAWVGYHPFAGPAPEPEQVRGGISTMREAFPDLRVAEVASIREGNKVAFRWIMSGTQEGEFMGVAPAGRRVEAMGLDIVRLSGGEIAEHWGEFDAIGLLRQLGIIPPPGQIGG